MTTPQDKARAGMLAGLTAGHKQAETDRRLAQDADRGRAVALLDLAAILPRPADSRPARAEHVLALAESVAAVGLLQPVAVDKARRLIAGKHRLEACRLLLTPPAGRQEFLRCIEGGINGGVFIEYMGRLDALPAPGDLAEPLRAGKVPARVLLDLDAEADPDAALAAEAAENTARKSYTPAEVAALAERLRAAGYREATGRPRKGQKALRPALELVLGVSLNTARRMLGRMPRTGKGAHVGMFSEKPADVLARSAAGLRRALEAYAEAAGAVARPGKPIKQARALAAKLAALLARIEET